MIMKWWSSVQETRKGKPIGFILLSTFLVLFCITVWAANSVMQASEHNADTGKVSFSNHAQEQHARNVAISAARKDLEVIAAFSEAKESGDSKALDDAKSLLRTRTREIYRQIAEKRASGMGWGDIAKYYGIHPSVLGLGHSKIKGHARLQAPTQARRQTTVSAAKAKSSKGDRAKANGNGRANGRGGGNGRGNGNGHSGGHGGGHGGGKK
jgi:uncharacterized membrane protein YgcG